MNRVKDVLGCHGCRWQKVWYREKVELRAQVPYIICTIKMDYFTLLFGIISPDRVTKKWDLNEPKSPCPEKVSRSGEILRTWECL